MEKLFYTAKDIQEILGYKSTTKSYDLIRRLNVDFKKEMKEKGIEVETFGGRINKKYFDKRIGIEGND